MVSFPKISPNLLLGVGGLIAVVLVVNQIRGAGKDLFGALPALDEGIRKSIGDIQTSISNIKFPEFKFPEIFTPDTSSSIAGQTVPFDDTGSTITIPADTTIDPQTGIVTSSTPPLLNLSDSERAIALSALEAGRERSRLENELALIPSTENLSGAEFASARNEAEFRRRQQETEQRFIPLPTSEPRFDLENPINTLREVLEFFPEITSASQARDLLAEFGGSILPSDVPFIDPDVRNISGGSIGGGIEQSIPIDTTTFPDELRKQEVIAARFTCEQFGLNCDIADSMMA